VPDERDDAELVRLVAADDTDALRVLYERYGSIVFGMARRVLGDRQLAEECTQDVFVALWRGAAKYEPERARVSTWLIGITRYRAIDLVRRRAARPVDPYGEIWRGDESPDSADLAATADQARRVAAAVAELPAPQRDALMLAYFEGLSHSEIADRLEVPLGTVKGRIRLALDRLRELAPAYALNAELEQ
jgi:RNA polymerase sigma-70 factor (ECF subfamily)